MLENNKDIITEEKDFDEKVIRRLDEVCRLLFESVKDKLDRKYGCFELFGLDFMLDDALNPYLIEINTNPAIFCNTKVQKSMMPKLVDDVVKLGL